MRSQSMMVCRRWAIVSTVQPWNFFLGHEVERPAGDGCHLICSWMRASVLGSTLAVASSRTSILFLLRTALARQSSCLWPTDRFEPGDGQEDVLGGGHAHLLHSSPFPVRPSGP